MATRARERVPHLKTTMGLGTTPGALDGRHGERRSPASSGGEVRALQRMSMGETRHGRESGGRRGSKRS
jgi:hypothetical protein